MSNTVPAETLASLYANRFAFGPLTGGGGPTAANYAAWLQRQLNQNGDPAGVQSRLNAVSLTTQWSRGSGTLTVDTGPLATLSMSRAELWARYQANPYDSARPLQEVCCAWWIRGVWSHAQLQEVMVGFWHNHFSVDAGSSALISAAWPTYDRMMRNHAFGNFRQLLGQVAKSTAMMRFLNLADSRKIDPNENFAREVMELHTLGIAAYFGLTTPAGMAGQGYSDQDVTEAARLLTGWTLENGKFAFNPAYHDTGTKTVLGQSFGNAGQAEGETFLDILAAHPATALNISTKLYQRFVADTVPAGSTLLPAMVQSFLANLAAPDQIAQLIQLIATSDEFAQSTGLKVKTPAEFMLSTLRAIGAEFDPTKYQQLSSPLTNQNAPLFQWPQPDGAPDTAFYWTSTGALISRWRTQEILTAPSTGILEEGGVLTLSPADPVTGDLTPAQIPAFTQRLASILVPQASASSLTALTTFATSPEVLGNPRTLANPVLVRRAVGVLVAATLNLPEFQLR